MVAAGNTDPGAWLRALAGAAQCREQSGLRRVLRPRGPGDALVDLSGNDYLGLSRHPAVLAAANAALSGYGLGATGSRLVRGSTDPHTELEARLAGWLGTGAALVFSSGFLANLAALRALAGPGTTVVSDAHNHASLVDGVRLARPRVVVTPHLDLAAIEAALAEATLPKAALAEAAGAPDTGAVPRAVLVTESVFSVDGDLAPLRAMHALCRRYGAVLLVDDAHGTGLLGPRGAGAVAAAGLCGQPDVVVTLTLSKAFGAAGGVVAGPVELVESLVDTGRSFIYDTALAPALAAGALAALDLIEAGDDLRAELADRATLVGKWLADKWLAGERLAGKWLAGERLVGAGPVSEPAAGVVSVTAPGPREALDWAAACRDRGVAVGCFRPPSTPDGTSRLRLTVNVGVPRDRYEAALDVIAHTAPVPGAPTELGPHD